GRVAAVGAGQDSEQLPARLGLTRAGLVRGVQLASGLGGAPQALVVMVMVDRRWRPDGLHGTGRITAAHGRPPVGPACCATAASGGWRTGVRALRARGGAGGGG